jgi:hypothetical protein
MGEMSPKSRVTSAVPQGSVLSPLLFSFLILDINKGISLSMLISYANDTKDFSGISGTADEAALQSDLENVYNWADENN